jgi:hypothetical protein
MNATLKEWTDQEVRDMLDEIYPQVEIGDLTFAASRIVEMLDPTAFRCTTADMADVWICGECNKEYDEKDDAEECCKEEEE